MSKPKQINVDHVKLAITHTAMTIPAIADSACLSQPCVQAVLELLRAQDLAYIEDWQKLTIGPAFRYIAMHRYGVGVDKPKPPVETPEQKKARNRMYRQRAAQKKLEMANIVKPFRHPQDEALFGPAPKVWTGSWQSKARVFRQPMTVTNDEMEVA
jgi:hypothetical protein